MVLPVSRLAPEPRVGLCSGCGAEGRTGSPAFPTRPIWTFSCTCWLIPMWRSGRHREQALGPKGLSLRAGCPTSTPCLFAANHGLE